VAAETHVISLMDALRKSVDAAKSAEPEKPEKKMAAKVKKPASKKETSVKVLTQRPSVDSGGAAMKRWLGLAAILAIICAIAMVVFVWMHSTNEPRQRYAEIRVGMTDG
jgi:hypothetical protein